MLDVKKSIYIDANEFDYTNFDSDQAYVDFPVRFPTVTIQLESTNILTEIVDAMRVEAGHKPMMYPDGWKHEDGYDDFDCDGWYNYYVTLNGFSDTMLCNCIEAIVDSPNADDDGQSYDIDLTEAEQIEIYNELNKQLKERFNSSCDALLEEARQLMIEEEEYRRSDKYKRFHEMGVF